MQNGSYSDNTPPETHVNAAWRELALFWIGLILIVWAILLAAQLSVTPNIGVWYLVGLSSIIVVPVAAFMILTTRAMLPSAVTLHSWGVSWATSQGRGARRKVGEIRIPFDNIVQIRPWLPGFSMVSLRLPSGVVRPVPSPFSRANMIRVRRALELWQTTRRRAIPARAE
jgi:hypothetical protein